jgi:hypothetical protein
MSFLVFSSATVMDVKNDTMLAVSTSLHGCQLLAGIIGNKSYFSEDDHHALQMKGRR